MLIKKLKNLKLLLIFFFDKNSTQNSKNKIYESPPSTSPTSFNYYTLNHRQGKPLDIRKQLNPLALV